MSGSQVVTNIPEIPDYLMIFFVPFLKKSDDASVTRYILDPNTVDVNVLLHENKDDTNLETPNTILDYEEFYEEIKNIFLSKKEDEALLFQYTNDLLKFVLEHFPGLVPEINVIMSYFFKSRIDLHNISKDHTIQGGSKNFIYSFLFSFFFLVFLKPAYMFSINSNVRMITPFPSEQNTITKVYPLLNDEKYNPSDIVKQLVEAQQNPEIAEIMKKHDAINYYFQQKFEDIEGKVDELSDFDKALTVFVNSEVFLGSDKFEFLSKFGNNIFGKFKKGLSLIKIITQDLSLKDKMKILVSDVLESNNGELVLNLLEPVGKIIKLFPNRLMKALSVLKGFNGAVTSPEFEVAIYAAKHILKEMKKELYEKYGEITPSNLQDYVNYHAARIGGKRKNRKHTIRKKRNKPWKKSKKVKSKRKGKK